MRYLLTLLIGLSITSLSGQRDTLSVYPDAVNKKKLTAAIAIQSGFYIGGMSYLYFVWYKDRERVPFHLYNDSKGYLQIDKMGHAYGAYLQSLFSYKWYRNSGMSKNKAFLIGGTMGIVMQTPIEVFDGLYEGWGFSWSDMAANSAGSLLVIGNELLFDKQLIHYKFGFKRSSYADQANGYLGYNSLESLFYDYNGHTYWLSTSINNFMPSITIPKWLSIAVGYSANGMFGEFENRTSYKGVAIPETERYRQYLISLDVDWTKIETNSSLLKKVFQALNLIKLPAPTLELNNKGKLTGYWIYL